MSSSKRAAPKREVATTPQIQQNRLGAALQAITSYYGNDPTGAGVHIAYLAKAGKFYAAVKRYHDSYGAKQEVVCTFQHEDLKLCVEGLLKTWHDKIFPLKQFFEEGGRL